MCWHYGYVMFVVYIYIEKVHYVRDVMGTSCSQCFGHIEKGTLCVLAPWEYYVCSVYVHKKGTLFLQFHADINMHCLGT